jgi:hypothetical protein
MNNIHTILSDFRKALNLAGVDSGGIEFDLVDRGCPHTSAALPGGKMAIYIFMDDVRTLKVGKVGPNSNARFQAQHYLPGSSKSNLAKSLLDDEEGPCRDFQADEIGPWMKKHLRRIDILLDTKAGIPVLNLLEGFFHCRLSPKYEGFKSQRV